MPCLTPTAGHANQPAAGGHSPSWLCCARIAQAQRGFPCGGHKTSSVKLPVTELLWSGPCPIYANTYRAVFPVCQHLQGCAPLYHTCVSQCSPPPHMPPSRRAVFPLRHTLPGLCSPYATLLQGHVPLMPHTRGAELPICQNEVKPSFSLPPCGIVRRPGSHSAKQLTDLTGGALKGISRSGGKAHLDAIHLTKRARSSLHLLCLPPLQDPWDPSISVPSFMPTFTPSSSGLEVLVSAALAQLPSAHGRWQHSHHLIN